tara:strand:+ start:516 stop:698 length:183 start_codon:yes stop_codon:yes gene_type:complete
LQYIPLALQGSLFCLLIVWQGILFFGRPVIFGLRISKSLAIRKKEKKEIKLQTVPERIYI